MAYVGIQAQIRKNNTRSVLLLLGFPLLILTAVWAIFYFSGAFKNEYGEIQTEAVNDAFIGAIPAVLIAVGIWFLIAFFSHTRIISRTTGSETLQRKDNMRVYNLVENLCIAEGMPMPKLNVIESNALNAFASGINEKSYTVTLTRGVINKLDDHELQGVIAHELMHIKNKDVRLLIVSIIFVGILAFAAQIAFRNLIFSGGRNRKNDGRMVLVATIVIFVAYLISLVFRFALSRKREYMADAGAAEMTKNPKALASALRKISGNYKVESVKSEDVAEMFIENRPDKSSGIASFFSGLFATHPPIDKRIQALENY